MALPAGAVVSGGQTAGHVQACRHAWRIVVLTCAMSEGTMHGRLQAGWHVAMQVLAATAGCWKHGVTTALKEAMQPVQRSILIIGQCMCLAARGISCRSDESAVSSSAAAAAARHPRHVPRAIISINV
jgi:hypothetical protein